MCDKLMFTENASTYFKLLLYVQLYHLVRWLL